MWWLVLLLVSFVPVWRRTGSDPADGTGYNIWQILSRPEGAFTGPDEHIHIDEAIRRAKEAGYIT